MKVELTTDPEGRYVGPLLTMSLPTSDDGYVEEGELGLTGGNLYIVIDGKEYGSLWFHERDGQPQITLGQFVAEDQHMWDERNPITEPVKYDEEEQ